MMYQQRKHSSGSHQCRECVSHAALHITCYSREIEAADRQAHKFISPVASISARHNSAYLVLQLTEVRRQCNTINRLSAAACQYYQVQMNTLTNSIVSCSPFAANLIYHKQKMQATVIFHNHSNSNNDALDWLLHLTYYSNGSSAEMLSSVRVS
ncbi:hypothetical protein Nepgr_012309 [Nepenthes gracilis]|uniref:Uncharacterized protein n=1 Tax=Nepenthes gracilis TaxID=150966 RepID=A0AAD3XMY8_NEPGR|nr:hypothetical protein Nepgr_012309 [Nepenthes gracilis]